MISRLQVLPLQELQPLLTESEAEGYRFIRRLREDWLSGANRFDRPGEALFGCHEGGRLVAIGGLNRQSGTVGRLRRVYVRPGVRRKGVGRALVGHILAHASQFFDTVVLRTDTVGGDAFYRALGFCRLQEAGDSTHRIRIRCKSESTI